MDSYFLTRRIHSLTGLVPVGLFLVYHLYLQLYLHSGAEVYNEVINGFYDSPLAIWSLVIVVYIPLFFHAFFGIRLIFESKVQPSYTYFSHLLYWLQRISGVGVLLFTIAHVWNAQLGPWVAGTWGTHFEHLSSGFADPDSGLITKAVYLLGTVGAVFHFSNGINTFCMTWGIALTPKSQIRVRILSILLFIILAASAFYALSAIW
jgi:succinate dehydrogenase / fumarate reductase cytochrome b subunit